jgi:hypothetical protein
MIGHGFASFVWSLLLVWASIELASAVMIDWKKIWAALRPPEPPSP